jgi:hypothetical protein
MSETLPRILVQTARQPGLAEVYNDILSYDGAELHFTEVTMSVDTNTDTQSQSQSQTQTQMQMQMQMQMQTLKHRCTTLRKKLRYSLLSSQSWSVFPSVSCSAESKMRSCAVCSAMAERSQSRSNPLLIRKCSRVKGETERQRGKEKERVAREKSFHNLSLFACLSISSSPALFLYFFSLPNSPICLR